MVRQAPSLQWDLGDAHGTVMLRMPLHPVAIELLREVGPMAVSSANISGRPAAVTVEEARDQLGDLVEVYLGGGTSERQAASTIVDLTSAQPRVLRQGPVTVEAIAKVLGVEPESLTDGSRLAHGLNPHSEHALRRHREPNDRVGNTASTSPGIGCLVVGAKGRLHPPAGRVDGGPGEVGGVRGQ